MQGLLTKQQKSPKWDVLDEEIPGEGGRKCLSRTLVGEVGEETGDSRILTTPVAKTSSTYTTLWNSRRKKLDRSWASLNNFSTESLGMV